MDIKKFAVEETSTIALLGPDDAPLIGEDKLPMTWTVYGPGSKQYAKAQAVNQNRMLDKLKKKGKTDQSAEDKAREQAEFLAGCTKECSSNIDYDGLKGEALYKAVLGDITLGFIAEQVAKQIGEWGNFTRRSATS